MDTKLDQQEKMKYPNNNIMENNFEYSLLKDYPLFHEANKDNWTILSYLNMNYSIDGALAFYKFFIPDFIFKKGCLILSFRYNETIFNSWYDEMKGEVSLVERMCNLYEIKDFFHIHETEKVLEKCTYLGEFLKYIWQIHLDKQFGQEKYEVCTFAEYGSLYITLNSKTS